MKLPDKLAVIPVATMPPKEEIVNTPIDDLKGLYNLCCKMRALCISSKGVGLSALQIGIPWRLFVAVKDAKDLTKFRYFVDCDYVPVGEKKSLSFEGCLSLKLYGEPRRFEVQRYDKIKLVGKEVKTQDKIRLIDIDEIHEGELAIIYQHESDHGRGVLISHIGKEVYFW